MLFLLDSSSPNWQRSIKSPDFTYLLYLIKANFSSLFSVLCSLFSFFGDLFAMITESSTSLLQLFPNGGWDVHHHIFERKP